MPEVVKQRLGPLNGSVAVRNKNTNEILFLGGDTGDIWFDKVHIKTVVKSASDGGMNWAISKGHFPDTNYQGRNRVVLTCKAPYVPNTGSITFSLTFHDGSTANVTFEVQLPTPEYISKVTHDNPNLELLTHDQVRTLTAAEVIHEDVPSEAEFLEIIERATAELRAALIK